MRESRGEGRDDRYYLPNEEGTEGEKGASRGSTSFWATGASSAAVDVSIRSLRLTAVRAGCDRYNCVLCTTLLRSQGVKQQTHNISPLHEAVGPWLEVSNTSSLPWGINYCTSAKTGPKLTTKILIDTLVNPSVQVHFLPLYCMHLLLILL